MKNKIFVSGLALAAVINVSALVTFAYHRWLRPQEKDDVSELALEEHLCLSGEQKNCLKDLMASYHAEVKEIQNQLQEKRRSLVEEMKKEMPDQASIDKLIEEISRLQAEIQKKAVLHLFLEKKLLTPEQKERYLQMLENHVCPKEHGRDSSRDKHQDCLNSN